MLRTKPGLEPYIILAGVKALSGGIKHALGRVAPRSGTGLPAIPSALCTWFNFVALPREYRRLIQSHHTNLSRWVALNRSLRLLCPKPRLSLVGLVLSRAARWFGWSAWICETMPRRDAHVGVAQTALKTAAAFRRIAHTCTCHLCVCNMEGFPGNNVNSGALLTVVGQSSRYTDHEFVATKHAMPPAFSPGNLVHGAGVDMTCCRTDA